jgi:hypothetical protein
MTQEIDLIQNYTLLQYDADHNESASALFLGHCGGMNDGVGCRSITIATRYLLSRQLVHCSPTDTTQLEQCALEIGQQAV